MLSSPLVVELMTPDPVVVRADDNLAKAAGVMSELDIRHLPVVDERGNVIGLLSQRDLLAADEASASVWSAMSTEVITVAPETPADEAARLLLANKLGCVPVVDPGGIVGIVTETDLVRVAYAMLAATRASVEHRASSKKHRPVTRTKGRKGKVRGRQRPV